jgi:EF hand
MIRFGQLAKSSNFYRHKLLPTGRVNHMITRRIAILAALGVAFYPVLPALPASDPDLLAGLDTDHDGTVSLDEAKKAAEVMFDKLDRDHDGTLTGRELRGRLSAREFAAADADKDGTISKDEYLAVVEQRFKAADTDNDGTLTRRELTTKAGRQLLLLLR